MTPVIEYDGGRYIGQPLSAGLVAWHREGGKALLVLPAIVEGTPERVVAAYTARVVAVLGGCCPACGSKEVEVQSVAPRQARMLARHEADCPAIDDRLLARYLGTAR